jgi:hypothetical protein
MQQQKDAESSPRNPVIRMIPYYIRTRNRHPCRYGYPGLDVAVHPEPAGFPWMIPESSVDAPASVLCPRVK